MVHLFLFAASEYCEVALSLRQAFSEGQINGGTGVNANLWVFALNMCVQSES